MQLYFYLAETKSTWKCSWYLNLVVKILEIIWKTKIFYTLFFFILFSVLFWCKLCVNNWPVVSDWWFSWQRNERFLNSPRSKVRSVMNQVWGPHSLSKFYGNTLYIQYIRCTGTWIKGWSTNEQFLISIWAKNCTSVDPQSMNVSSRTVFVIQYFVYEK